MTKTYSLVSFSEPYGGALIDFKVLTDDAPELKSGVPGMDLVREATTEAADYATAYCALVAAMVSVPERSPAAAFWNRVALIPRIRVAARRCMGLRNLGPVMRGVRAHGGSEG